MPPSMWDSITRGCAVGGAALAPTGAPTPTGQYDIHTRSHTMTNNLTGKVALVTGGSRGIGAAIAKRLARDGAAVAITYAHAQQKADEVVHAIEAAGGSGPGHSCRQRRRRG